MADTKKYLGYHGTSKINSSLIQKDNFKVSHSPIEWLGHGTYFFIEGIACPVQKAREWAIVEAWDNRTKSHKYNEYVVLSATIVGKRVFDLREQNDLIAFNKFREHIIKTYCKHFEDPKRKLESDETYIYNLAIKAMKLDILINNLYMKTTELQRKQKIFSRTPNCTVMVVIQPKISVVLDSIKEIETGSIS
jgi:hypothetical protein